MISELVNAVRWVWGALLLQNTLQALASLVSDGIEAWANIGESLCVIFYFLRGRSHRCYPLVRGQLAARKALAVEEMRAEMGRAREEELRRRHRGGDRDSNSSSDGDESDPGPTTTTNNTAGGGPPPTGSDAAAGRVGGWDSTSDDPAGNGSSGNSNSNKTNINDAASPHSTATGSTTATTATAAAAASPLSVLPIYIQRRILLGKKGERDRWLEAVAGCPLVPLSFPQSYSHSLHSLVSCVVGPIQQPTVTTMPNRHPLPQWPPHYVRNTDSSNSGGGGNSGGPGAPLGNFQTASTDEYSSCSSVVVARRRPGASGSGGVASDGSSGAGGGGGFSVSSGGGGAGGGRSGGYRQAANVVYRRASARQMAFHPTRKSGGSGGAQVIASITAHHVLSYQATRQKVLVMDLDETLCHVSTTTANMLGPPTFSEVIPTASGAELFHVWERPHARLFIATMAKLYNLVLFTSASKPYADTILRRIDPNHLLRERYYRQDCRVVSRGALARTLRERKLAAIQGGSNNSTNLTNSMFGLTSGGGGGGTTGTEAAPSDGAAAAASAGGGGGGHSDSPASRGNPTTYATTTDIPGMTDNTNSNKSVVRSSLGGSASGGPPRPKLNEHAKVLMKDLRILKVPLELLVMIDNSEECMLLSRENSLIVSPYIPSIEMHTKAAARQGAENSNGNGSNNININTPGSGGSVEASDPEEDEVLLALISFLESMLVVPDVRSILRHGKVY